MEIRASEPRAGAGGECSFRTVDTLLVKHCDVGMRLRYEIECIGYVGLFRPRTPDSPTTFRLPAGGRGDVIVRTGTSPVGKQFSTHSLWGATPTVL